MKPEDSTQAWQSPDGRETSWAETDRRSALVREMVQGAILPGLLARKDAGIFDRGPNVLRMPTRSTSE